MWRLVDGNEAEPQIDFKHMTNQQMREAAANTITFLLDTWHDGWEVLKEMLHTHIDVQARYDLGPNGEGVVAADATFEEGVHF